MNKSVQGKIWRQTLLNENYIQELKRNFEISDLLAQILSTRVNTIKEAADFLTPKIKNSLPDPFHLLDMAKGVERVIEAILNNQKICIFADYDVDGATSSALIKNVLRDLDYDADIYVPDRIIEGYGPTALAMQKIKNSKVELLITVDCGAMAHEALEYAAELELDVIVIDHHMSVESLPPAVAIINPNRIDETSEYKYLAAVGVSFLFVTALISKLRERDYFKSHSIPNLMNYLGLVALGTVCDVMSIVKLNRVFVAQGLKVIHKRHNLGIKTLFDITALSEKPNCYHLGFVIGPRINAGGRVGKSSLGANLLSSVNEIEAIQMAWELDKHNNERKVIELMMLEEALSIAEKQKDENLLFIVAEGWHVGVIGIIAGRLKEKFNKPVAVIALNDGIAKASCRSIKGIDFGIKIIEAKNKELIVAGGGHAMAAGFTATKENLQDLQNYLKDLFKNDFEKLSNYGVEEYNISLTANGITPELINELNKLEPYGNGNSEPIFKISNLFVLKADIVGEKHIKCLFVTEKNNYGTKSLSAIAFNAVDSEIGKFLLNKRPYSISIIGTLKINNWQMVERVQLQLKDLIVE